MAHNDGGPAFPQPIIERSDGAVLGAADFAHGGMTLRDYFAAQSARQAAEVVCDLMVNHTDAEARAEAERHAKAAYMVADALLQARTEGR